MWPAPHRSNACTRRWRRPGGLSRWWTRHGVRGESSEGSRLQFFVGQPEPAGVMEVARLRADGQVSWDCIGGAEERVETTLTFDLASADDETVVLFTHAGWRSPSEFMAHCSARWAYFLRSLTSCQETGTGTPFPEDLKF